VRVLERHGIGGSAPASPLPGADGIEETLSFLVDEFGFRRTKVERADDEISVTFKNSTTGIRVSAARDKVGMLRANGERVLRGDFTEIEGMDWWNARHG
jgi:hypothetical protein